MRLEHQRKKAADSFEGKIFSCAGNGTLCIMNAKQARTIMAYAISHKLDLQKFSTREGKTHWQEIMRIVYSEITSDINLQSYDEKKYIVQ